MIHHLDLAYIIAGVTACITCFPLDLLRTRILADPSNSAGIAATLRSILRAEGFTALYGGCLPALMSVGPSGAVFYGVYDLLKVSANVSPLDAVFQRGGMRGPPETRMLHIGIECINPSNAVR